MIKLKTGIVIILTILLLFPCLNVSGIYCTGDSGSDQKSTVQTQKSPNTKQPQTKPKTAPATQKTKQAAKKPVQKSTKTVPASKPKEAPGSLRIGTQVWAAANLDVITFRNGDSIPEAKTNKDWVAAGEAGKPAWCYYNNDPKNGKKYGKLYNWFAVNDPRELAPAGWTLSNNEDWSKLAFFLGGPGAAGTKLKSTTGWIDDNNGTNETGFNGLPGGYRVENGLFMNIGSIGTWWSSSEGKALNANDHYVALSAGLSTSSSNKQRGESVRCIKK